MRFTLSSTALSSRLNALSRVINSKNSLPILADFLFDIHDNVLYLTASDSENVMKTQLDLTESDGNGRFAIGNHDLLEAVKGFSEQPITFDVDMTTNLAKISYQNGLFSLPIENADEYPQPQGMEFAAHEIVIPNILLAEKKAGVPISLVNGSVDHLIHQLKTTMVRQKMEQALVIYTPVVKKSSHSHPIKPLKLVSVSPWPMLNKLI